jgi:hypothetical protein
MFSEWSGSSRQNRFRSCWLPSGGIVAWRWNRKEGRPRLSLEALEDRVVPALLGQQLFPADNPWNQDISNAPVAANSAAIIARIGTSTRLTPDWYADDPTSSGRLYGIPYNVVHGNSTARVNVLIDNYPGESDIQPVPIPANAVLEGDYQNRPNPNGGGYRAGQRGDSHLIVWDEDTNIAYELYGVTRPADSTLFPNTSGVELPHTDGRWHAAQETVWDMNTDTFRTLGATSADAAGLSILAGLARPDEGLTVAQGGQGVIDHALRVTLPSGEVNPQYIYPGSHMVDTSQGASNLPLGGRLRLANTPAVNTLINNMPPESQIVARAMQRYGLIVADIGSAMYVSGASASVDANNHLELVWNLNDIFASNGLEALHAGNFEVVNLRPVVTGLSAHSGGAGSTITINGQNFSGAAGHLSVFFGSTAASSVTVLSDTQLSVVVPSGSGSVHVTVQSGVNEIDHISGNPNANVNAPIFGYGTSAPTSADMFAFASTLSVQMTPSADHLVIRANPTMPSRVQVYNIATSTVMQEVAIASIGNIQVDCDSGTDTLTVDYHYGDPLPSGGLQYQSGAGVDTLNVDDSNNSNDQSFTLTDTTVQRAGSAPITLQGGISYVNINGGSGDDSYVLAGTSATAAVNITGGSGNNQLTGSNAGNLWSLAGTNAGSLSGAAYASPAFFSNIANLIAGSGGDTFAFADGASITGNLTGGGGDALDYTEYTSSVVVDLQSAAAGIDTGVGGVVSGITSVAGGSAAPATAGVYNLLIGAGGNYLQGGTGRRNILVAGGSASTLVAGDGEDLLIAGSTTWDTEAGLVSWQAIAAYWAGSDDFGTRMANLLAGNGVPILDPTAGTGTVVGNGGGNTLMGNGGVALIFSDGLDSISNFADGSQQVGITP